MHASMGLQVRSLPLHGFRLNLLFDTLLVPLLHRALQNLVMVPAFVG
jgi:hypothetical protein